MAVDYEGSSKVPLWLQGLQEQKGKNIREQQQLTLFLTNACDVVAQV